MRVEIEYSKSSMKFLKKNSQLVTLKDIEDLLIASLKKILHRENSNIDVKQLRGKLKGYYRTRKGRIRMIFSIRKNEIIAVFVYTIDFRGNVY